MGDNMVTIGEKLDIVLDFDSDREKTYFSMIHDILDEDNMVIHLPMSKGETAFLHIGQNIAVNYFRCHGQYYFMATVVERYEEGNSHFFKIKKVSEICRLQRRNYYRLPKTIPVEVEILSQENENSTEFCKDIIYGHTCDICGGGLGITTGEEIPIGAKVRCLFQLEGDGNVGEMEAKGRVVRCSPWLDSDDRFEVGICFEDMAENQRDEIVKFIFSEQRRLRRSGLI